MANDMYAGAINSRKDYKQTPADQYKYWEEELNGAMRRVKGWWKQGDRIVARFLDSRRETEISQDRSISIPFRLNLFHSNITSLISMLYGNLPKVDVSRRYADPTDDVSRVAAEIMERLLNNDIAENGEQVNAVLRSTLQDRLLPGLGVARVRYDFESEMQKVESISVDETGKQKITTVEQEVVLWEDAPTDYFYWGDVLWSWGRNWSELTWLAYRSYITKDEAESRFGEDIAKELQYRKQTPDEGEMGAQDTQQGSVWNKAEVWEIWDKVKRQVVFVSMGYAKVLETRDDPLQLSGFFPSPPFFLANQTTKLYKPTPDFNLAQDLYNEIDKLQTRIAVITEAVKVVGVYDAANADLARMFSEGVDNRLIPVNSWALFGEKGGLQGAIDWVPIADIVNALDKLVQLRDQTIALLRQVTGMNEVLRGGSQGQYEGVGQAELQAKFGSIRIQALQDEFAVFCSNLMQLKAEVIARHFSPETIAQKSNIGSSFDRDIAPQAIELIKRPEEARLRIEIRPESVAMVDYAQLKMERTEYINALAIFMQSAAPLIEQQPQATPFLLQLLQWGLSGFKGSQEIEGVIDKAIDQANRALANQGEKPDPAMQAAQMQQQLEQMKQQAELAKIQAKAAADERLRLVDRDADIATRQVDHTARLREIEAELQSKIAETRAKMEADIAIERAQAESNIHQTMASAEAETGKDVVATELEIGKEVVKSENKINEITTATAGKIREAQIKDTKKEKDND